MQHANGLDEQPGHNVSARIAALYHAIERREPELRAFTALCRADAMTRAEALDALPPAERRPLHGLPIAVKEVIDVAGLPVTWGSALQQGRIPAGTASLVQRLLDAGAVVVGITASMEYAIAAATATTHPTDASRTPGGSSSGSAAAVGAGLLPLALGTQTIGSIVRPAAYCGAVGFKPSHGRYPADGMLCLSPVLDHPGLIADRVDTVIEVDRVLGCDARTPGRLRALRFVAPWYDEPTGPAVTETLARLRRILVGQLPLGTDWHIDADIAADEGALTHTLLTHDLASGHGDDVRTGGDAASPRLQQLVSEGMQVDDDAYAAACASREAIIARLHTQLAPGEIAIAPATVDVAPPRTEGTGSRAPQRLWTLAGMPTLTLPAGRVGRLPVGVQFIAREGEDALLLACASRVQALLSEYGDA